MAPKDQLAHTRLVLYILTPYDISDIIWNTVASYGLRAPHRYFATPAPCAQLRLVPTEAVKLSLSLPPNYARLHQLCNCSTQLGPARLLFATTAHDNAVRRLASDMPLAHNHTTSYTCVKSIPQSRQRLPSLCITQLFSTPTKDLAS